MMSLNQRIKRDVSAATSHTEDRNLLRKRNEFFKDQWNIRQLQPRLLHVLRGSHEPLSLSVVTHPAGLEYRRQPDLLHRGVQIFALSNFRKVSRWNLQAAEQPLLPQAVLSLFQRRRGWVHRHAFRQELR